MSARLRPAAALVVAAAIPGAVLLPATAHADTAPLLRVELTAPASPAPLTRGGATETFELTVENPGDKARAYHPWLLLEEAGPSPLQTADVVLRVEPVEAPATASFVGHQDGGFQGMFHPAAGSVGDGFQVPAGGELTWKVTVGLTADYPTVNGGFTLTAASTQPELEEAKSLGFSVAPQNKPGAFRTWFEKAGACEGGDATSCQKLNLHYKVDGHGSFTHALNTQLLASYGSGVRNPGLTVQARVDGRWQDVEGDVHTFRLPRVAAGFGADSGERVVPLRFTLAADTKVTEPTGVTLRTETGLESGNTYAFAGTEDTVITLGPARTTPAPSATPTAQPSSTPSATPSPSATSSAPAAPATTAAATPATTTTGALAKTGSGSGTFVYTGMAAALIALGATAWFATRRLRGANG
ncbi:hypothetical protein ACFTXJ_16775 [Streptomyces zhihengii]|uniref:hypothetical protein n=1 Tax=Streptomyces zhihengii TaxID=1818004 RepID=UPI00362BB173